MSIQIKSKEVDIRRKKRFGREVQIFLEDVNARWYDDELRYNAAAPHTERTLLNELKKSIDEDLIKSVSADVSYNSETRERDLRGTSVTLFAASDKPSETLSEEEVLAKVGDDPGQLLRDATAVLLRKRRDAAKAVRKARSANNAFEKLQQKVSSDASEAVRYDERLAELEKELQEAKEAKAVELAESFDIEAHVEAGFDRDVLEAVLAVLPKQEAKSFGGIGVSKKKFNPEDFLSEE